MSDYLYLFRGGREMDTGTEEEQRHMQRWLDWIKDLGARGHFKAGEPLADQGKVVRGKHKEVTDGPYAEAKDIVGGYLIVSARDLDHATELARGCPIFLYDGVVEVRPIRGM